MKLFGRELTVQETIGFCKNMTQTKNNGCDDCLMMDASQTLIAEIEHLQAGLQSAIKLLDEAYKDMKKDAHCSVCLHHRDNGGACFGVSSCGQGRPAWEWVQTPQLEEIKEFVRRYNN